MITVDSENVRAAREAARLSIHGAARAAKINFKTIVIYEGRGDHQPPKHPKIETLLALARAYKVNPRTFATDPKEWDEALGRLGLSMDDATQADAEIPLEVPA